MVKSHIIFKTTFYHTLGLGIGLSNEKIVKNLKVDIKFT